MKDIRISPAAEAALARILEFSIKRWGLARAEAYKDRLLERIKSVARGELPHPRPCDALMSGKRNAAGLCYCREGAHFIVLRNKASYLEVVEFIHASRDLERLLDRLASEELTLAITREYRWAFAVVERAFHQVRCRCEVFQALLILNTD